MNKVALALGCLALAFTSVPAPAGIINAIVWDFNPSGLNKAVKTPIVTPSGKTKYVKTNTLTTHGSATGLNPLDATTPLVTVSGFNANTTAHTLFQKKMGKSERGLGLTGTKNSELTLTKKGTLIANYLLVDMTAPLALKWEDLVVSIKMDSVGANSKTDQEKFDVWGSDSPSSFGTKLISASATNGSFVTIPMDGDHYNKYYFVTTAAQGKGHSSDNVLLQAVKIEGTNPVPEPVTMGVLALGAPLALRRKRR
ncbi:MAG: hypothetical protein NTV86_21435 [Planctomycetota bacterium]|nr:hypothetical protein [Planctomycetota bacterium]